MSLSSLSEPLKKNKSPKKDTTVYLSSFMFRPAFVPFNLLESV